MLSKWDEWKVVPIINWKHSLWSHYAASAIIIHLQNCCCRKYNMDTFKFTLFSLHNKHLQLSLGHSVRWDGLHRVLMRVNVKCQLIVMFASTNPKLLFGAIVLHRLTFLGSWCVTVRFQRWHQLILSYHGVQLFLYRLTFLVEID